VIALSNRNARAARLILQTWRCALFDGHVNQSTGLVEDEQLLRELAELDALIATLNEALKKAKGK